MADVFTASGTKVFIGPPVTATPANAAAYAALSWVEIGMIESVGEFGDEESLVTGAVIGDGRMRKSKGAADAGELPLTMFHAADDAGQAALLAAQATKNNYAFKVELPNKLNPTGTNELQYFKGLVRGKRLNVGQNDNLVRRTVTVAINSAITEVAPTAGV